ncbi:MAG: hypothetical protein U9N52_04905, partial [Campylobacterota bacterium]|nr:hypothetical protein [Campylobacterota bacterium]
MANDKKISELPDGGGSVTELDSAVIVQDGITKKSSLENMKNMFNLEQNIEIGNLSETVGNLATAQAEVNGTQSAGYVFDPIQATFTQLPYIALTPSTDEEVFVLNDTENTITFKRNANINLIQSMILESATNAQATINFRVVNVADDSVVYSRSATVEQRLGDIFQLNVVGLLTIGRDAFPSAPITLRLEVQEDNESYKMVNFNSVISSSSSYDVEDNIK